MVERSSKPQRIRVALTLGTWLIWTLVCSWWFSPFDPTAYAGLCSSSRNLVGEVSAADGSPDVAGPVLATESQDTSRARTK